MKSIQSLTRTFLVALVLFSTVVNAQTAKPGKSSSIKEVPKEQIAPVPPLTPNFLNEISTAITRALNEKAIKAKIAMNYFQVTSVAFTSEKDKEIAGQKQKMYKYTYVCTVIEESGKLREGDKFTGKGSAEFVTDAQNQWKLHTNEIN